MYKVTGSLLTYMHVVTSGHVHNLCSKQTKRPCQVKSIIRALGDIESWIGFHLCRTSLKPFAVMHKWLKFSFVTIAFGTWILRVAIY